MRPILIFLSLIIALGAGLYITGVFDDEPTSGTPPVERTRVAPRAHV